MAYRTRRLRWRRKARRIYARRKRYFRRAGVVSKFATPGAMNKLSEIRNTGGELETAALLTKIIEANRCIKIIYKAWKSKNPRMITLSNYIVASDNTYKSDPKSEIIKKMRELNKRVKIVKIAASMGQSGEIAKIAKGDLLNSVFAIAVLSKCKNIGQMMMVHQTLQKTLGTTNAEMNESLNAMINKIIEDVKTVIPYAIPTVAMNNQMVNA